MSVEARLKELGIELPPAKPPLYAYVPVVVEGGLAWVSGQLPWVGDQLMASGTLGAEVDVERGREVAAGAMLPEPILRDIFGRYVRNVLQQCARRHPPPCGPPPLV